MRFKVKITVIITLLVVSVTSCGQEKKLTIDVGADLVSSYVWRGVYQPGVSIQPRLSLSAIRSNGREVSNGVAPWTGFYNWVFSLKF